VRLDFLLCSAFIGFELVSKFIRNEKEKRNWPCGKVDGCQPVKGKEYFS